MDCLLSLLEASFWKTSSRFQFRWWEKRNTFPLMQEVVDAVARLECHFRVICHWICKRQPHFIIVRKYLCLNAPAPSLCCLFCWRTLSSASIKRLKMALGQRWQCSHSSSRLSCRGFKMRSSALRFSWTSDWDGTMTIFCDENRLSCHAWCSKRHFLADHKCGEFFFLFFGAL